MADAPAENAPKSGSKLVPILIVVNSLLVAVVLALFLLRGNGGGGAAAGGKEESSHEAHPKTKEELPGPTIKLADFVVHLRDVEADRYARVSFEVEVATEEDKAKLTAFMPRIRDAFTLYLSDRTLEELRGGEAIGRIKTQLSERMTELAPACKVKALYVTDLVIQ